MFDSVFPNKNPLAVYFGLLKLFIEPHSSKKKLTLLDDKRKRLIMGSLLRSVGTIHDVNLLDNKDKLGYFYLQTLFIHLLTPTIRKPDGFRPIPQISDFTNLIVPKNDSGSSCFCDAVLVAMFLTTHKNDRLLAQISFSEGQFYPWEEAEGEADSFLSVFDDKPPKTILMTNQEKSCGDVNEADEMIILLMTIVASMREIPKGDKDMDEKRLAVGKMITEFRGTLSKKCAIGTPFRQENAPRFLVNMVKLNYMSPVFFPLVREVRVDSFYSKSLRVEEIPDLVTFGISDPSITILNPGEAKTPRTLQEVINSEYLQHVEIEINKDPELFKKGSVFDQHISKFTNLKNLTVERKLFRSFIKLPKFLTLEMSRAVSTANGPRKVQFDITVPDSMELTIPLFESTNTSPISPVYRIIAIVCHTSGNFGIESGHYIAYFLPHKEKYKWLLYDDVRELMLVDSDITKTPHANTIKRDAVLYFLIKK